MGIYDEIKAIVIEQLGVDGDKVNPNSKFIDDLGADSLDMVELTMALEDKFSISISDEEAQKITTIKDAVEFIENELANQ